MVYFVDLEVEDAEPTHHLQHDKLLWNSTAAFNDRAHHLRTPPPSPPLNASQTEQQNAPEFCSIPEAANVADCIGDARGSPTAQNPNWNSMTEALGCYP